MTTDEITASIVIVLVLTAFATGWVVAPRTVETTTTTIEVLTSSIQITTTTASAAVSTYAISSAYRITPDIGANYTVSILHDSEQDQWYATLPRTSYRLFAIVLPYPPHLYFEDEPTSPVCITIIAYNSSASAWNIKGCQP